MDTIYIFFWATVVKKVFLGHSSIDNSTFVQPDQVTRLYKTNIVSHYSTILLFSGSLNFDLEDAIARVQSWKGYF